MIAAGNSDVKDRVADGRVDVGILDEDDAVVAVREKKPVAIAIPDQEGSDPLGTPLMPNVAVLIQGAPHPSKRSASSISLSRQTPSRSSQQRCGAVSPASGCQGSGPSAAARRDSGDGRRLPRRLAAALHDGHCRPEHLRPVKARLRSLPLGSWPAPWRRYLRLRRCRLSFSPRASSALPAVDLSSLAPTLTFAVTGAAVSASSAARSARSRARSKCRGKVGDWRVRRRSLPRLPRSGGLA